MAVCDLITYNMIKRQKADESSSLEVQVRFHSLGNLKAVGWNIKMANAPFGYRRLNVIAIRGILT